MTVRISGPARRDIARVLTWSAERFGEAARDRYERLIFHGIGGLATADPPSSRAAPELEPSVRIYHLRNHRARGPAAAVARPRHLIVYRREADHNVEIIRLLHEASDLTSRFAAPG